LFPALLSTELKSIDAKTASYIKIVNLFTPYRSYTGQTIKLAYYKNGVRNHEQSTSTFNIECHDITSATTLTIDPARYDTKGAKIKIEWTLTKKIYYPRITVTYAVMPAVFDTSADFYDAELYVDDVLHRITSTTYPNSFAYSNGNNYMNYYIDANLDAGKKLTIIL